MKIQLLAIGKTNETFLEEGIAYYSKRISKYNPFTIHIIPGLKKTGKLSQAEQKKEEGARLLKQIDPGERIILLDHKGKAMDSLQFAKHLDKLRQEPAKRLTFVIGGSYGFAEEVYQRADSQISLSPMTFSHQIVRLMFLEQLYRAFTILHNEPYHHG